jgi:hypothetical protein
LPTIISDGGGDTAAVSVPENTTLVTDVNAADPDAGTTFAFSIVGGADESQFSIDGASGVLSFLAAPNFESPADAGGNNVYDVLVEVSDGSLTDTQAIAVSVTNVNEPPAITSSGGGDAAAVSASENTTAVTDVNAADPDANTTFTFSISGGADAAQFAIDAQTGVLNFVAPPDFENPSDAGGNNVYDVVVEVSDGGLVDSQALAVTVLDVQESAAEGFVVLGADAGKKSRPEVKVFDAAGNQVAEFLAYEPGFHGGVRVALGDVTGDGTPEIITGPGRGRAALVKVFDLAGNELPQFRIQALPTRCKDGVYVAVGDVLGDGLADIIVGPGRGKPEVRIFENRLNSSASDPVSDSPTRTIDAFGCGWGGGVTVAAGDIQPGGKQELIVGSGPGRRTTVKAFDVSGARAVLVRTWLPFSPHFRGGVFVSAGDTNGDSIDDVIFGTGYSGGSKVEVHSGAGGLLHRFVAYAGSASQVNPKAAVRVAAKDLDGDRMVDRILTGQGPEGRTRMIRSFDPLNASLVDFLLENDPDFAGGYFLA